MQPHVLGYSTIVGVEILVIPLIALSGGTLAVVPAVVGADGNDVSAFTDIWREVETTGHNAILGDAQLMAVEPEVGSETDALKLDEEFSSLYIADGEVLTVPDDGICEIFDTHAESLIFVESAGQCHRFPACVVVGCTLAIGHITDVHEPPAIEVQPLAVGRKR